MINLKPSGNSLHRRLTSTRSNTIGLTECDLHIMLNSFCSRNLSTAEEGAHRPTPLFVYFQTCSVSSNPPHNKSHKKPDTGTLHGRFKLRIGSRLCNSGDIPPCMQNTLPFTMALTGRQSKHEFSYFQASLLLRCSHSSYNPYIQFI